MALSLRTIAALATFSAALASGCASAPRSSGPRTPLQSLTKEARRDMIRRSQVWAPTDIPAVDIKTGPPDKDAFPPGETVACDKTDEAGTGKSPKFYCKVAKDDEVKVKYGSSNGEVYAEVVSTRLLWALGFHADRMYPVRVVCRGCSADPWRDPVPAPSPPTFDPASVERKLPGKTLESKPDSGWKWPELDLVDESRGGAPLAHRDALKLLAVMIKHTDSKAAQQRLLCPKGSEDEARATCTQPVMMINDAGVTFGKPNLTNSNSKGSLNYENWTASPIWKDADRCVANLKKSFTGTLNHPRISEAGRRFLADLLVQLSDQQIHDLFEVARVERRQPKAGQDWPQAHPVADWVKAFKKKRDEIVHHSCPE
jgi:hypothetical protein